MKASEIEPMPAALADDIEDEGPRVGLVDLLTWLGDGKRLIGAVTLTTALAALVLALLATPIYTARTALIPPGSQQQSGSAAALAALGSLGGFVGGLGMKTSDELYVTLLKSESVTRALDERFDLKAHYQVKENETLRKVLPSFVRISADKKSGVIIVEVDDKDAKFAADL